MDVVLLTITGHLSALFLQSMVALCWETLEGMWLNYVTQLSGIWYR